MTSIKYRVSPELKLLIIIFLGVFIVSCTNEEPITEELELVKLVNPFIGTGGHGHTYPGASAPFGFCQLSPDTRLEGWDGCGGYHYSDSIIYGFSHTHLSGTGVSDYGDILLMPFAGASRFENGANTSVDFGYGSRFDHENEHAEAGFYSVLLSDYNIAVELTTSQRCGMHRYVFPEGVEGKVILDLEHRDQLLASEINIINENAISGKRFSNAWAEDQRLFFHLEMSQSFISSEWNSDSTKLIISGFKGELLIKVGLSAVSKSGAKMNLDKEMPAWNFDAYRDWSQALWEKELSKVRVEMMSPELDTIFYTAMYHAFLNPNVFMDVDGSFRSTDGKIYKDADYTNYTIFSLWDTYRATHPLFSLIQREKTEDFIQTFLNHYEYGGSLPVWELAGNYTGCMIGYHSIPVIVDAYFNGIDNFDTELALEAMLSAARGHELGKEEFGDHGYIAADQEHESVSKTLEYAYDDWCIARFAQAIGNTEVYEEFIQRAQNYKNIIDPRVGFARSKRNQQFTEPFDPKEVNFNFTEANSWQYSFYAPQDVSGLIDIMGGEEDFENKLDELFETSSETSGREQVDITGLIGQYAHGNEPSHHMAYLYNFVGASGKTQKLVRQIMSEMYLNTPDGIIGNEDCGQMSAWYIFSALGFYPVTPGYGELIIGSPLVENALVNLENGRTFEVVVKNQRPENIYIESIRLNGKPYAKSYFSSEDILNGGTLEFVMSSSVEVAGKLVPSISKIQDHKITPVPFVIAESQVFSDSLEIHLACAMSEADIFYSMSKKDKLEDFSRYAGLIVLRDNAEVRFFAKSAESHQSKLANSEFYKVDHRRKVMYDSEFDPQYSAGGDKGLIDHIRGGKDFRTGAWQGWQGQDVSFVLDLSESQDISRVSIGSLQDLRSWILMPKNLACSCSLDGISYDALGFTESHTSDSIGGSINEELSVQFSPQTCRYVKIELEYYGILPEWHLGAGGEAWMFLDEVTID